jgi:hypothetical protein
MLFTLLSPCFLFAVKISGFTTRPWFRLLLSRFMIMEVGADVFDEEILL